MSIRPEEVHPHADQMNTPSRDKTYVAEKLRGAAVMYGPAIVLDLFEGISVLAMASGKLASRQGSLVRTLCARSWL